MYILYIYIYMLLLYLKILSTLGCHYKIKDWFFNQLFGCLKANLDLE